MITIRVVCVGKLKERFWQEAQGEYVKRLSRFCKTEIIELEEQNKFDNIEKIIALEGEEILNSLSGKNILLDLNGKELASEQFANKIETIALENSTITFVIGGSYGVSNAVKQKIGDKLSFGKATYPHNLARIILLEQIYRAFMINSNCKYHK
jgi:23S rRNA (pseudouridine1915-N3)-methyltransferase